MKCYNFILPVNGPWNSDKHGRLEEFIELIVIG